MPPTCWRRTELRPLLTYAIPHLSIQFRIELIRVHLTLADLAGARTLMREVDELLRWPPKMGVLVEQAEELRARLSRQRSARSPGTSALTAAMPSHDPIPRSGLSHGGQTGIGGLPGPLRR
jgi:hypothetical protein